MCPTTNDEQSAQLYGGRKLWRFGCEDVGTRSREKSRAKVAGFEEGCQLVAGEG